MAKRGRHNATGRQETVVEDRKKKGKPVVLEEKLGEWILETRTFDPNTPPVELHLSMGLTKNLGEFQFARMDIGVSIPCMPEEMEHYFKRAKKWITTKLQREVQRINEDFVE